MNVNFIGVFDIRRQTREIDIIQFLKNEEGFFKKILSTFRTATIRIDFLHFRKRVRDDSLNCIVTKSISTCALVVIFLFKSLCQFVTFVCDLKCALSAQA